MRRPYDRGFESICSKVATAPAANVPWFGAGFQTPVMHQTVFVCLHDGKISSYAAMMEAFQMKKYSELIFIRLFPKRLDSILQHASSSPTIENTYPQLM
jgi:hypothetical protein